jgi:hypothetical protein
MIKPLFALAAVLDKTIHTPLTQMVSEFETNMMKQLPLAILAAAHDSLYKSILCSNLPRQKKAIIRP